MKTIPIYIATGVENAAMHQVVKQHLEATGFFRVTYDWPNHQDIPLGEMARLEVSGVCLAQILVVLLPGLRGTHTELGIAIGAKIPVLLFGRAEELQTCPFYHARGVSRFVVDPGVDLPSLVGLALGNHLFENDSGKPVPLADRSSW